MSLSASRSVNASVDQLVSTFADQAFQKHVSELVGGALKSISVEGPLEGEHTVTVERTAPTTRLPDIARKLVGDTVTITQTEQWEVPAADGSRTVNINVKISGAPVTAVAKQVITPLATGSQISVEGEVKCSIPLVGKKVADAAAPMMSKALNLQAVQAEAWLAR